MRYNTTTSSTGGTTKTTTSTSYTITGLSAGTTYYIWVSASNSSGTSAQSSRVSCTLDPEPETEVDGSFTNKTATVTVGEKYYLKGTASVTNSTLKTVTVNTLNYDKSDYPYSEVTQSFTSGTSISLASYSAYVIDTSKAPFNTPGTYTLNLWVKAADGTYANVDTMRLTTVSNEPQFDASFYNATKTIYIGGERWLVEGTVSVTGGSGYLGKVTINAYGVGNSNMTQDFTDHNFSSVELQYWYAIDTTVAPWNTPGTYTLQIWAKDTDGVGGTAVLDTMTLVIKDDEGARQKVVDHAYEVYNYTWNTDGYILVYYNGYNPDDTNLTTNGVKPVVVTGTVRGIPYSLSANGNGAERTYGQYRSLSASDKLLISKKYSYGGGTRVSMLYGMSCATFVTECMIEGLPGKGLSTYAVTNIHSQSSWAKYITQGSKSTAGYKALQKGDYLYSSGHVMLVVDNDGSSSLTVIEQTPPDYARNNCSNKTSVTVTLTYNGTTKQYTATKLCMNCAACRQAGVGTQKKTYSYSSLTSYYPMYVDYTK